MDKLDNWFPEVGLGLCIHRGSYDGMEEIWLRWCDAQGKPLLTGKESVDAEAQRADAEAQRADSEAQRADAERARRLALESRLRELGELP